jgi:hypothetical protein
MIGCQATRSPALIDRSLIVHQLHRFEANPESGGISIPLVALGGDPRAAYLDRDEGEFTVAKMLAYDEEARRRPACGVPRPTPAIAPSHIAWTAKPAIRQVTITMVSKTRMMS